MDILERLFGKNINKFNRKASQKRAINPYVIETKLQNINARFEAIAQEDRGRILNFDGEGDYYQKIIGEVKDYDCFWDIGSFIGLVAIFVAKKCPHARIVAVEPDKSFCQRIKKNLILNNISSIELFEIGLADKQGNLMINTSGVLGWAPSFYDKGLDSYVETPVSTIDHICKDRPDLIPNVLKIDVEGFEGKVISGSDIVLQSEQLRTIFLELHPIFLSENGERIGELLSRIENYGFRFESFQGRKNEILTVATR